MTGADTIMTTTLPTVIGAGVVSKTTDTMFSKQGTKKKKGRITMARRKAKGKLHTGPKGGKYRIRKGRKVYV